MTYRSMHMFAGSGGDALGFAEAGFEVVGLDLDPRACKDFRELTKRPAHVVDIAALEPFDLAMIGPCPDVLVLSAPCKSFSGLMSAKKAASDKYVEMSGLALRAIFLATEAWKVKPRLILFENVPRIKGKRGAAMLEQLRKLLAGYGYKLDERTHDCGEIGGLAQHRRRYLLVARDPKTCPDFLREPPKLRVRSVAEELFRLPVPRPDSPDPMHVLPKASLVNLVRFASIRGGKDWKDIPAQIEICDCTSNEARTMLSLELASKRAAKQNGGHGVEAADAPAHAVVGRSDRQNSRGCVEDLRITCKPHNGHYGTVAADQPSQTIRAHHKHDRAPSVVEDVRLAYDCRNGTMGTLDADEPADTVRGCHSVRQAPACVADLRVQWDPNTRAGRPDCYAVLDADEPSGAVRAKQTVYSSAASVADPRVSVEGIEYDERGWPVASHVLVRHLDGRVVLHGPRPDFEDTRPRYLVIASYDEATGRVAWHRPMTDRELACLQSFPTDFIFCGPSSSGKKGSGRRERIGNAIPCAAAKAIALECMATLEASDAGGFHLSSGPIWVEPGEHAHA